MNNNTNLDDSIVIVGISRTPIGGFQGNLKHLTATELGSFAIRASLEQSKISSDDVDEVLMGCVLPAGVGQAPQERTTSYLVTQSHRRQQPERFQRSFAFWWLRPVRRGVRGCAENQRRPASPRVPSSGVSHPRRSARAAQRAPTAEGLLRRCPLARRRPRPAA